jgi:hypothetical protein
MTLRELQRKFPLGCLVSGELPGGGVVEGNVCGHSVDNPDRPCVYVETRVVTIWSVEDITGLEKGGLKRC